MKVFRVVCEYLKDDSDEIITQTQFVTHDDDDILSVTKFMAVECASLEQDLKSVEEVLVICQHIEPGVRQ